jgi:hypothetical protein
VLFWPLCSVWASFCGSRWGFVTGIVLQHLAIMPVSVLQASNQGVHK